MTKDEQILSALQELLQELQELIEDRKRWDLQQEVERIKKVEKKVERIKKEEEWMKGRRAEE